MVEVSISPNSNARDQLSRLRDGPTLYCNGCEPDEPLTPPRPLDDIMDDLTIVTDAIGRGDSGLGEEQERLIIEMNDVLLENRSAIEDPKRD